MLMSWPLNAGPLGLWATHHGPHDPRLLQGICFPRGLGCRGAQPAEGPANADAVVGVAASHGHHFSKTVLLRQHAEALSQAHDHELEGISSWSDALMHCFGATEEE